MVVAYAYTSCMFLFRELRDKTITRLASCHCPPLTGRRKRPQTLSARAGERVANWKTSPVGTRKTGSIWMRNTMKPKEEQFGKPVPLPEQSGEDRNDWHHILEMHLLLHRFTGG